MERLFTMKYNTSISHGIEFNLGNGEYHSLSFSILPDMLELFVNKEYLFMHLYEYAGFKDSYIGFKRKKQSMFSSENKELFREDKFFDIRYDSFPLIKSRRLTQRKNEGISFYVTNLHGTESLDSTFYIDSPSYNRGISYFDEVFAAQYDKNLHSIEEAKRIAYIPKYIFEFDPVRIKDKYENKYPTILNEYLSVESKKTELNESLTDVFININVPQIFEVDDIKISLRNRDLYYDPEEYFLGNNHPDIFINTSLSVKNGLNNNMHIANEWSLLGQNTNELHYIEEYVGLDVDLDSKKLALDDYIQAGINNKDLYYLDSNGISLGSTSFEIDYDENIIRSKLVNSRLNINNLSFLSDIKGYKIEINEYFINVDKYYHEVFETDNINLLKSYKKSDVNTDDEFLFRSGKKASKQDEQLLASKNSHEIYSDSYISLWRQNYKTEVNNSYEFAAKSSKEINVYEDMLQLNHAYGRPIFIDENVNVSLYDKEINFYSEGSLLAKGDAGIRMEDVFTLYKGAEAIRTNETGINLSKAPKGIEFDDYYITFNKSPKGITEEDGLFIDKLPEGARIDENTFVIDKGAEPAFRIYEDTWVNKNIHDSSIIYDYPWVSKNMHDSSIVYDYPWVSKNMHDSSIVYDYPWISKNMHDSSIVYDYPWVKKDRHDSSIVYENQFAAKTAKDIYVDSYILNVDKASRGIYLDENIHIDRISKGIRFDDNLTYIDKSAKGIGTEEDLFIGRDSSKALIDDNGLTADYDSREIAIEEIEFVDIDSKAIELFKQVSAKYYSRGIYIEEEIKLEKEYREIWFDDYCRYLGLKKEEGGARNDSDIRLNSAIKHGNLDYQGVNISKRKKDTYLPQQSNFLEIIHYEDPDPDKPPVIMTGKIDELILPHKDYKYSNFIKKLINDDGTINWTYVKSYDSATGEYTISIPMENPISIYADIGRDYLDVDVAILEIVIYLVKKVWKDNMYKYIAFSAHDSLKHIMVEVDNLLIDYGLDDHQREEAVRCMQLFRWYAEMAVLNNCEYILKFDTTKISVDYYNKDLGDFQDIITFDNMEITDNYIIEPIDETKTCGITFKNNSINPGLPLNLSFRLYNINTSSSISIIDKDGESSIKTYEQGIHDITEELENRVMVRYIPSSKYQSINIANIVIDNKSIRGFTVIYKGKFGETNAVMQELLDSMLVVGEASDELKEKLKDVSPVTIAISTMVKYFDLHHENKLKGKRLIIKK